MTRLPDEELRARLEALPSGGAVVVVVAGPGESDEEACDRAARVAASAGESRSHTILAAGGPLARSLDGHLGADGPGLAAVFRGELTLAGAAVGVPGQDFVYLPSGLSPGDGSGEQVLTAPRAARLASALRSAGGTLVFLVDGETAAALELEDLEDLRLERRDAEAGKGAGEVPVADVREEGGLPTGRWRRHRKREGLPIGRIVLGGVLVAAIIAGWWLAVRFLGGRSGREEAGASRVAVADTSSVGGAGAGSAAAAATPSGGGTPARLVDGAPTLPYSVLIASYATRDGAVRRAQAWSHEDGILYLVAPTPVQGRLYYRLFAGALPSRDAAARLMKELVDRGRKEEARAWDVRPASLAFRLAVTGSRRLAAARADSLDRQGIPVYLLPAAANGDTAWQLYAGAYESKAAAAALGTMLQKVDADAHLVKRRGTKG